MPYKTGTWGPEAKARNERRRPYFRERSRRISRGLKLENRTLGFRGEQEALEILPRSVRVNQLHDLDWKGKKVEVKTAIRFKNQWYFSVLQQRGKVDYFLFICKDRRYRTIAVFLIPDDDLTQRRIVAMSPRSMARRYAPYLMETPNATRRTRHSLRDEKRAARRRVAAQPSVSRG